MTHENVGVALSVMMASDVLSPPPHQHYPGSQCILQVLLVSSPANATPASFVPGEVYTKPFAPWKPGDAYSVENDLSDWRLLLGTVRDGEQAR